MKKLMTILIMILGTFSLLSAKLVILELNDGTSFRCEPLYCSDSLLYVWTGIDEFNINFLIDDHNNNTYAIMISDLNTVRLRIPKRMAQSAKTAFTSTLLIGGAITLIGFRDQDIISILGFNGLFNIILGSGITLLFDIFSNIPKNLNMTNLNKIDKNLIILRNYCALQKHPETKLIEQMILDIKP